jgi:putative membrane protein
VIPLRVFPSINAALNGIASVLLIVGFALIRARKIGAHRACMLTATGVSILFLASYLYYHFHAGVTRFPGSGLLRNAYLGVLFSHTVLAATVPFLVGITLWFALRGRVESHRRVARWAFPIWLYVSLTGVLVYWMLYHLA